MTLPIDSILGIDQLTGLVANPLGGVPAPNLPPALFSTFRNVSGIKSSYLRTTHVRTVAQLTDPNAPSKRVGSPDASEVAVTLFHSREHHFHNAVMLQQLMSPSTQGQQDLAVEEIGRKTAELNRRQANLFISAVNTVIRNGKIWFDGDGNLLPSSSGTKITVDYEVPATSLDNTNIGDWDTAGTNILKQIADERQRLQQLTGLVFRHCIYGKGVAQYLANNTAFATFIQGSPALSQSFATNRIPNDFGQTGLSWWPGDDMWYQDAGGTIRNWMGDNTIILIPDPSPDWFEIQRGTYVIPARNIGNIYGSAEAAANGFVEMTGRFSYATVMHDPPGIRQIVGDTYLPIIKVPGALRVIEDVTASAV